MDFLAQSDFFGMPWGGVGFIVAFVIVLAVAGRKRRAPDDAEGKR